MLTAMSPPIVKPAGEADLAAINDIFNHYVHTSTCTFVLEPLTMDERRSWFAAHGPQHPVLVAVDADVVVGWGSLSPWRPPAAYAHTVEFSVYVDPLRHREGIGRALVDALVAAARALGHHAIIGATTADQAPSLALQRALGFVEVARFREVGRKFDRWLDVVCTEKLL
jgi:phosphinothricin acetyltransferase